MIFLKTSVILTDKNVALLVTRTVHVITAFAARIKRNYVQSDPLLRPIPESKIFTGHEVPHFFHLDLFVQL